ncbi:hypothetical protein HCN44_005710 [Aphidius gifuensis]|uniref:F-box domain-containing protein n=1 Tax=Aphidius gifuensis TaxID=684658 RepID=A0A835CRK5_APHGI|nr:F-box protein SKIP2-like [Aphidius gifuensis]KAF7992929.1 hypothetical protein HCN44_005710 [Aphidius gifuensis]
MEEQNLSSIINVKNILKIKNQACNNNNSSTNLICDIDLKKKKITNDTTEICQIKMQSDNIDVDVNDINDVDNIDDIDEQIEEKKLLTIDVLNYDCLANVLSYLSIGERLNAEKVCIKWKDAIDQLGWHDVTILNCFDYDFVRKNFGKRFMLQSDLIQVLLKCGKYLTHLSIVPKYNSEIMSYISEHCVNLTKLELYFNVYYDEHFINAFSKMDKLKYIKIKNYIRQRISGITNDNGLLISLPFDIEEITFSTPSLRHSALAKVFASSLEKFTALKSLTLSHWSLEEQVIKVIGRKTTLKYLDISNCEVIDAESLSSLNNLEYLDVSDVQNIDDDLLRNIINNCKSIKHINISNCIDITKYSLNHLGTSESLKELLINGILNFDDSIINRLHDIKILECRSCIDITDTGIIGILNNSPNIERLDISDTGTTILSLKTAADITKNRINNNNKKLYIIARDELIEKYDDINNIGKFLVIEECKKKKKIITDNRRNHVNYNIQYRRGRRVFFFNIH